MKIVTYIQDGRRKPGAVVDGQIVDLSPAATSVQELIEGGPGMLARAEAAAATGRKIVPVEEARLLAPLPQPVQIRDCLVFEDHLKNSYARLEQISGKSYSIPPVWYKQPIYYKANRMSVIGPNATIEWPSYANILDYELEIACIVGKTGKDIPADKAADHIFGFTVFNDVSARDTQAIEMTGQLGPAKGKDFDTGNILGPWIVTRDEIGDWHDLKMEVRVNGERRGGGTTASMHHTFEEILAYISLSETLYAGEVIGSGTVGTGCGLETGTFLEDGDVVELEVEKIGILKNTVRKPKAGGR